MSDKTPAAEAATTTTEAEATGKEAIYLKVAAFVEEKTGKKIGKTGGHTLFDIVVAEIFAAATKDGSFRFNGGFGSLHVKTYQAGERRLPSGATTKFDERQKLRYEQGVVVEALVGNGGNLDEALKARGSRAKPEGETKEKAPKPSKETPTAETKTTDEPAAAAPEGDLDLD